jgi:dTDP-4-amino-4,6-dideoxygalactose transaminase
MHAWHLYVVRLTADAPVDRDTFIERMHREHGIGCSVHYIPLHQHPFWRDELDLAPAMFPHSEDVWQRIVSLPIYSRMTEADTERVIAAVRSILC